MTHEAMYRDRLDKWEKMAQQVDWTADECREMWISYTMRELGVQQRAQAALEKKKKRKRISPVRKEVGKNAGLKWTAEEV